MAVLTALCGAPAGEAQSQQPVVKPTDTHDDAQRLLQLGIGHLSRGEFGPAIDATTRALAIFERLEGSDGLDVAYARFNLGLGYSFLGKHELALQFATRALSTIENQLGPDDLNVALALNGVGQLYLRDGKVDRALPVFERALAIRRKRLFETHPLVADSLKSMGQAYASLGQPGKALELASRALEIMEKTYGYEHLLVVEPLLLRGAAHGALQQYSRAASDIERAIAIHNKLLGSDNAWLSSSLTMLAFVYARTGRLDSAIESNERALTLAEKHFGPDSYQTSFVRLMLGLAYGSAGRHSDAYRQASQVATSSAGRRNEYLAAIAWGAMSKAAEKNGQPSFAIVLAKHAVNSMQSMRQRASSLGQGFERSLTANARLIYVSLADLLISQSRIAEAQQVLEMLKQQELFEFIRRDESNDPRATRVGYDKAESPWIARYADISERVIAIGRERQTLEERKPKGLSPTEAARLQQIELDSDVARRGIVTFLDELSGEMAKLDAQRRANVARRDVEGLESYQDDLKAMADDAVMLHYIVLPDRLRIIVTTPTAQAGRMYSISEAALNRKIYAFRQALRNPRIDPRPLGKDLYEALIGPVEEDLSQAKAKTLALSLDGTLRYLPFAALFDGKQYLVERYRTPVLTDAVRLRPKSGADAAGIAKGFAGLGLTKSVQGFNPLPGVKQELEGILQDGNVSGEVYLDEAFTAQRIRGVLGKHVPLLHVASHFKFNPGTETNSFLVLGNGDRLSLRELREAGYNFRGVELLALSACETALGGGDDANGREVEGFGALAQQRGARSVLATLWAVEDSSTAHLMREFYRLRANSGTPTNNAEALRQAQLSLLQGAHSDESAAQRGDTQARRTRFVSNPKAPYSHPYFWAPFILMGNWL